MFYTDVIGSLCFCFYKSLEAHVVEHMDVVIDCSPSFDAPFFGQHVSYLILDNEKAADSLLYGTFICHYIRIWVLGRAQLVCTASGIAVHVRYRNDAKGLGTINTKQKKGSQHKGFKPITYPTHTHA